jgi:hypothetical protein
LWDSRAAFGPFAIAGAVSVLAGGIVASAIAAPAPTRHGVWAVAYLVLVLGVSQIALGAGLVLLADTAPGVRFVAVTAAVFNLANIGVLAGVVFDRLVLLNVGSVLLMVALGLFLYGVRRGARRGWPLYAYRTVLAVLAVSIPIGMVVTTLGPA